MSIGIDTFHAQHDYVCWFAEFPASKFQTVSGGELSAESTQQFPGGGGPHRNVDGPTRVGQITIGKGLDHVVDQPLKTWARAWKNGVRVKLTLIKQPVNAAGLPNGEPETYVRCSLVNFGFPDVNKGAAEAATLSIIVQPEDLT